MSSKSHAGFIAVTLMDYLKALGRPKVDYPINHYVPYKFRVINKWAGRERKTSL